MVKGRQRDARRAGWLGWASVLAVALTLTACPAPPTSPPLTASQRVELRPSDTVHLSLLLDEYVLWQAEGFELSFTGAPLAEAAIVFDDPALDELLERSRGSARMAELDLERACPGGRPCAIGFTIELFGRGGPGAIDVTGMAWRASVGCGGNAGVPAFHSEADLELVVD